MNKHDLNRKYLDAECAFIEATKQRDAARNELAEATAEAWLLIADCRSQKSIILPLSPEVDSTATVSTGQTYMCRLFCRETKIGYSGGPSYVYMQMNEIREIGGLFMVMLGHRPDPEECDRFYQRAHSLWAGGNYEPRPLFWDENGFAPA